MLAGILLLLLLPLDGTSRKTYISENALLPGQVHTYFDGSEHNVFRAYRQEVHSLIGSDSLERNQQLGHIFRSSGLKVATQEYAYQTAATNATGENVYAVLHGPRADATEAIVLIAAWKNMGGEENQSGVALVLTLARYFKRWSLWSKDLIFIVTEDSVAGPQAWVDAYHDAHDARFVQPLAIKSGALQGAVAIDYPAGPWGHRYDKLHIVYDGTNGQLPNLDLINTVVSVALGQMGISCALQRMFNHADSYHERLTTLARGMVNQALGHATGPHSGFMRYHVDAITLQTIGDGWHDEMSLGRTVEGIFRSLNNLLEHLHQSFFFYLLMQVNRFVSIGTYLPSAMCLAASYTIMCIALWLQTGLINAPFPLSPGEHSVSPSLGETKLDPRPETKPQSKADADAVTKAAESPQRDKGLNDAIQPSLFFPIILLTSIHFLGLVPLSLFNYTHPSSLNMSFFVFAITTTPLPILLALVLPHLMSRKPSEQEKTLTQCFALLLLGMSLAALATVNYSLSYLIGLVSCPLAFVRLPSYIPRSSMSQPHLVASKIPRIIPSTTVCQSSISSPSDTGKLPMETLVQLKSTRNIIYRIRSTVLAILLVAISPMNIIYWASAILVPGSLRTVLSEAAFGWWVYGLWTQVIIWLVWWPAWFVGGYVLWAEILS